MEMLFLVVALVVLAVPVLLVVLLIRSSVLSSRLRELQGRIEP